jgi:FtsH-binding integral membrane protein
LGRKTIRRKCLVYLLVGLVYPVSKAVFYLCDLVCTPGLILGIIAGAVTVCVAVSAFKERKAAGRLVPHRWAIIVPIIILVFSPTYMSIRLGREIFRPEKIAILAIFVVAAVVQLILSLLMLRVQKATPQPFLK